MSKVSDLIDPIMNYWDEDLVRQTLWPIDAQRVLAIPLSMHNMTDFFRCSSIVCTTTYFVSSVLPFERVVDPGCQ